MYTCIYKFLYEKITHDTLTIHVKENRRTTDLKVYLQEQHKFVNLWFVYNFHFMFVFFFDIYIYYPY